MTYQYETKGTCSKLIIIDVDGDIVRSVQFLGGCDGNLKGIAKLVEGMHMADVVERIRGIRCGAKNTSCPDQLSCALQMIIDQQKQQKPMA